MEAEKVHVPLSQTLGKYAQERLSSAMVMFIGLQCLDLLTTLMAFSRGGVELNPILRSLIPLTGRVLALFAGKAMLVSLFFFLARRPRIIHLGNILYSIVVVWNLAIVLALK